MTTIGRGGPLRRLLASLEEQTRKTFTVSICAQGNHDEVRALVQESIARSGMTINYHETGREGVSRGRNTAAADLPDHVSHLLFPNDTSVYPPAFVASLTDEINGAQAGCMTVIDEYGPEVPPAATRDSLTKRNAWLAISPGVVMSRDAFIELGGFDEELGTGARTPWQSAEETDLLLRHRTRYGGHVFAWLPTLAVHGVADSSGLARGARRNKLRGYSRGFGRVSRLHEYGVPWYFRALLAGALFGFRHGDQYDRADGLWVLVGRLEGLVGVTLGHRSTPAVQR